MPAFPCEVEGVSIVLVGTFNPSIVHPAWLEKHGLISAAEARGAQVDVVAKEIAQFAIGSLQFQLLQDRFTVTGTADLSAQVRDLVAGSFVLLEHTPVTMLGINRHMHFRMPNQDRWHDVGHSLAPKKLWEDLIDNPGLRTMTMSGKRPKSPAHSFRVSIEPSLRVLPGVYVGTNEHFDDLEAGAESVVAHLRAHWEGSLQQARLLAETLLERATK